MENAACRYGALPGYRTTVLCVQSACLSNDFRQEVDLEDVIFSKERIKTHLKADEERERNMVPIEEALAVSDRKNLRMLMMNVIRGDLKDSLESIMLAFM